MKMNLTFFKFAVLSTGLLLAAASAPAQNLYVANYVTQDIYQITPGGVQTVFAPGMDFPVGITFDSSGDLFVANSANNNPGQGYITKITPDGTQSTFASGLTPQAVAFNSAGDLFEADYRSGNIYEFTPDGTRSTFASGFSFPIGMTFDSLGNLFVGAGYGDGNGYVTKITPGQVQSTFATGLSFPDGLAFNNAGDLFVGDQGDSAIYEYTPTGTPIGSTSVYGVDGLAFDSTGDLFATSHAGSIVEITPDGTPSIFVPESGIPAGAAFAPVPEPSMPGLLAAGAVILSAYRPVRKAKAGEV